MSDTIQTEYGQSLNLTLTFWQDTAKTIAVDLTGATVTIREASRMVLLGATVVLIDASNGVVSVAIPEAITEDLPTGIVSWFRVEAQFAGANIVTPKIKVNVNG